MYYYAVIGIRKEKFYKQFVKAIEMRNLKKFKLNF